MTTTDSTVRATASPSGVAPSAAAVAAGTAPDMRRHRRVPVSLDTRYLTPDGAEAAGVVTDVSAGGARLSAKAGAAIGDRVVAYVGRLGRVEGEVVRRDAAGFALRFTHKPARAKRLADALTFIVNQPPERDRRRARRYPQDKTAKMVLADGTVLSCRILDISTTGASIGTQTRPPIGTELSVGVMRARIVRHHEDGVGVIFATPRAEAPEGTDPRVEQAH